MKYKIRQSEERRDTTSGAEWAFLTGTAVKWALWNSGKLEADVLCQKARE